MTVDADPGESESWVESQETIIFPWVQVLEGDVAAAAQVEDDQVSFPAGQFEQIDDLERGDILISALEDNPFMRRITGVNAEATDVVFETEQASLTQVFYKASFDTSMAQPTPERPADGQRLQELGTSTLQTPRNGSVDYYSITLGMSPQLKGELKHKPFESNDSNATASLTATPVIEATTNFYFSIEIGPGSDDTKPSGWVYQGTKTCESSSDCFAGETCSRTTNTCQYNASSVSVGSEIYDGVYESEPDQLDCEDLLQAIAAGTEESACVQQNWDAYYDSGGQNRGDYKCETTSGLLNTNEIYPPLPAQVSWAKDRCVGALKHLEMDMRNSARAGIEDIELTSSGSAAKDWSLFKRDGKIPSLAKSSLWFWVGWVPVYVGLEAELELKLSTDVTGQGTLKVSGFTGVEADLPGGGMHLYGTAEDRADGHFGDAGAAIDEIHMNEVTIFEPSFPSPGFDDVETALQLSASAKLELTPKISVLLYDAVGPFLEPLTSYANLQAATTNNTNPSCTVGFQAGLKGQLGLEAQVPFGLSEPAQVTWSLYDSCSARANFCPEGFSGNTGLVDGTLQLPCYTKCLYGGCDGEVTPEGDPKFVRLKVTSVEGETREDAGRLDPNGFELDSLYVNSGAQILEPVAIWDPETGQRIDGAHEKLTSDNEWDNPFVCMPKWQPQASCWGCTSAEYNSGTCAATEENLNRAQCLTTSADNAFSCWDTDNNDVDDECGLYAFDTRGEIGPTTDGRVVVFSNEIVVEFDQAIKAGDQIVMRRPFELGADPVFTGGPRDGQTVSMDCRPSGRVKIAIGDAFDGAWTTHHAQETSSQGFYNNQEIGVTKCDDGPSVDQACVN